MPQRSKINEDDDFAGCKNHGGYHTPTRRVYKNLLDNPASPDSRNGSNRRFYLSNNDQRQNAPYLPRGQATSPTGGQRYLSPSQSRSGLHTNSFSPRAEVLETNTVNNNPNYFTNSSNIIPNDNYLSPRRISNSRNYARQDLNSKKEVYY